MTRLINRCGIFLTFAAACVLVLPASVANGVSHSMTGQLLMGNPSSPQWPTRKKTITDPGTVASPAGTPINQKTRLILSTGAPLNASPTGVSDTSPFGAALTVPQSVWRLDGWPSFAHTRDGMSTTGMLGNLGYAPGRRFRTFADFTNVAQLTSYYTTFQYKAQFKAGSGAGSIMWCPRMTGCTGYNPGATETGYIGVTPGPNQFGGTFRQLRQVADDGRTNIWFAVAFSPVFVLWKSDAARFTHSTFDNRPTIAPIKPYWPAGMPNHYQLFTLNRQPTAYINGSFTNGVAPYATVVATPGTNIGGATAGPPYTGFPVDIPDGRSTGFKMTTGTIRVSDATPVPSVGPPYFYSTTSGYDHRDKDGNGNIVLVGGGIAYEGATGNKFFRNTRLKMNLPEPAIALGLGFGLPVLFGLDRIRRRRS